MSPENDMLEKEPKHQRRVRYKGTHPRTYKEKYKELNPEKYADTVEKVIRKGNTPAGMHISICVKEILEFLQIKPGQIGLDATLGYGGHTLEMLKCLDSKGHLYALDVDSMELPRTTERLERLGYGPDILETRLMNFSQIDQIAAEAGPFNFILADLGVSSMQIDNPDRGFSYKQEGPLDLRLNPYMGKTAASRLKKVSFEELQGMLVENADEPHAEVIARAIVSNIKKGMEIRTTTQLRDIIEDALKHVPKIDEDEIKKSCQRCFQALRIDINKEFDVLDEFLEKLPDALAEGGRVAILTFHSGEDRRVKKSFKRFFNEGVYREIASDPIRPSAEECHANSRARSAKLRWAIKA
ncbi:MAG: 16S rRNA (cytosine(1402)-N(4))-methyltransferase RsmH [Pseudomonadota bacterium]